MHVLVFCTLLLIWMPERNSIRLHVQKSAWGCTLGCSKHVLTQAVYRQATTNSHREWQYHMLHVYNCILLNMNTYGSKHVEENNILWINNNQCIKLVVNIKSKYTELFVKCSLFLLDFHEISIFSTELLDSTLQTPNPAISHLVTLRSLTLKARIHS